MDKRNLSQNRMNQGNKSSWTSVMVIVGIIILVLGSIYLGWMVIKNINEKKSSEGGYDIVYGTPDEEFQYPESFNESGSGDESITGTSGSGGTTGSGSTGEDNSVLDRIENAIENFLS
ncbi:MAG: hypothetical protein ABIH49_01485 [archaeon]